MQVLKIVKKADDRTLGKKVVRISIGGSDADGVYIVYRGDLAEVQQMLRAVEEAFSKVTIEPTISPDDGKSYA